MAAVWVLRGDTIETESESSEMSTSNFAAELRALFEKYDVRFDVRNEYTVEFYAGRDFAHTVSLTADPDSDTWDSAAAALTTYTKS